MKNRTFATTATATSAALLLLLAACGEDAPDTQSADDGDTGSVPSDTTAAPAKIRIAASGAGGAGAARAESADASSVAAAGDEAIDGKMIAPGYITYVADPALGDLTGARTSWFFSADGYVVTEDQKAALAAAFGMSGTWTELPADWGGGIALGPTDGTGPNLTISGDAMASWWYSPGPISGAAGGECVTSVDAATGEERIECPTPVPPANVPDQATAQARAIELFTAMGFDTSQFQFETYADEWGAWVTGWLTLDGRRVPVTLYAGFGENGAITGAGGFLARPIQGDQYELIGVPAAIERLNDQQYGWIGLGAGGAARSSVATAEAGVVDESAGTSTGGGSTGSAGGSDDATDAETVTDTAEAPSTEPATSEPATDATDDVLVDPAVEPCQVQILPSDAATSGVVSGDGSVNPACPPVEVQPITVTLVSVADDLTMVWDAEGSVWLLPAYTFTASDGGMYTVVAIADEFIELPEAVPAPEPLPVETVAPAPLDQVAADTLVGLTEDEALKLAESNGWFVRVVERDGESFPATADYQEFRVNLTVENGVVTQVTIG